MLRFIQAEKVTDVESAERILSKYRGESVNLKIDFHTTRVNILDAKSKDGILYLKFTWKTDGTYSGIDNAKKAHKAIKGKEGDSVRIQIGSDTFQGILGDSTEIPEGSDFDRYVNSPYALALAFNPEDQKPIVAAVSGSIIGMRVPVNIVDQLPLDPGLEYEPHITVAYFPDLGVKDIPLILKCAKMAAKKTGPIAVFTDSSTTFPTPQDDGTYPLVAKIKSQELHEFHDEFISLLERFKPGLADTTFAHKNYTPHVTLKYTKNSGSSVPIKRVAWTADQLYLSFKGGEEFFPIPLKADADMRVASENAFLQVGELKIPIVIISNKDDELRLRVVNGGQSTLIDDLEGMQATLVTSTSDMKMEVQEVRESGADGFQMFYRPLITYMSRESASRLRYVSAVAIDRGLSDVVSRIGALLDFSADAEDKEEDEDEDKEALGPGFPGTDSHIVTYVKAPQTQQIIEEPRFPKSLALHERI